jgi:hypothetical protein
MTEPVKENDQMTALRKAVQQLLCEQLTRSKALGRLEHGLQLRIDDAGNLLFTGECTLNRSNARLFRKLLDALMEGAYDAQ